MTVIRNPKIYVQKMKRTFPKNYCFGVGNDNADCRCSFQYNTFNMEYGIVHYNGIVLCRVVNAAQKFMP